MSVWSIFVLSTKIFLYVQMRQLFFLNVDIWSWNLKGVVWASLIILSWYNQCNLCFFFIVGDAFSHIYIYIYIYIYINTWGSLSKFADFFVWALLWIVHTRNSSPLRSNLLQLQCTCCTIPATSGRPHGSPFVWACQWPSSQPLSSPQLPLSLGNNQKSQGARSGL